MAADPRCIIPLCFSGGMREVGPCCFEGSSALSAAHEPFWSARVFHMLGESLVELTRLAWLKSLVTMKNLSGCAVCRLLMASNS